MKVLVQTNRRNQIQLQNEFRKIEEAGCTPVPYGYFKNDEENTVTITGLEDIGYDELVFNRPSIQILKNHFVDKAKFLGNIPKGFFTTLDYNPDRFCISKMKTNPVMLNKYPGMHKFMNLRDALNMYNFKNTFYKPDNDLKLIKGTFVKGGKTLLDTLTELDEPINFNEKQLGTTILQSINTLELKEEIRCFVVNGQVVTAARYRRNNKYDVTKLTSLEEAVYISHANILIHDYYSPSKSFTIDLARLKDESIMIIEYNCINTSGYYDINSKALFSKIKENLCLHQKK